MFLNISAFRKLITLPSYILEDDRISLGAKGLFVQLFHSNDSIYSLKEIGTYVSSSEEEITKYFNELAEYGYVIIRDKKCELKPKSSIYRRAKKTSDTKEIDDYVKTTQPKKKSAFSNMLDVVNSYDLPTNVKALLINYFTDWLNKKGRFADTEQPLTKTRMRQVIGDLVSYHLSEPTMLSCIQQSIDKGWYKFVTPKPEVPTSQFDKGILTSGSYTIDDIESIKRKSEELEAIGEKGTF